MKTKSNSGGSGVRVAITPTSCIGKGNTRGFVPRLRCAWLLSVLVLAVWAAEQRAAAQTTAGLSIQTYAGLTITGR